MSDSVEKSGIHVTGKDSGWPVGGKGEPGHVKDGTGADPLPHVTSVSGGVVKDAGKDEAQKVAVDATGGTFKLTFSGKQTAAIAEAATAKAVREALEALDNINPGDVEVTGADGGPFTITFVGQYADKNVPQMTADGAALTGGGHEVTVTTTQAGEPL